MTKTAKLHKWIIANPGASIPFRDFERLILAFGFTLRRTTGSHRHYARSDIPAILTVQPRGKDAKSYQIQQFLAICEAYGLTLDD
ncbi:type II toxin-antitoxin system HicA family toxin [Sphingomonas sp. MMS24-J45]|uniref:type II toxin-antitoxin system HicA family toxin n=1 Tax=Sphingomonas sp. MMS24-J45 TaxID=3238806 RepID=UPI00384B31E3